MKRIITSYFFSLIIAVLSAMVIAVAFNIESATGVMLIAGAGFLLSMAIPRNTNVLNSCFLQANTQRPASCGGNPAGMQLIGYLAFVKDITDHPRIIASPGNATEAATAVGTFTMESGKFFIPVYNVQDRPGLTDELVGPVGGKQWKSTAIGFIADIDAERIQFAQNVANEPVVYIGVDKKGKSRMVGTKELPAMMEVGNLTTGVGPDDLRGLEFNFSQHSATPAPYLADGIVIPVGTATTADISS